MPSWSQPPESGESEAKLAARTPGKLPTRISKSWYRPLMLSGGDQQRQRKGHLQEYQSASQTEKSPAGSYRGSFLPQSARDRGVQKLQDWGEAEQQTRHERGQQRKSKDAQVHRRIQVCRITGGQKPNKRTFGPSCKQDSGKTPHGGQHKTLSKPLPYQPSFSRSNRQAHGDLLFAPFRARQQQVSKIRARHEQHDAGNNKKQKQRPFHLSLQMGKPLFTGDQFNSSAQRALPIMLGQVR